MDIDNDIFKERTVELKTYENDNSVDIESLINEEIIILTKLKLFKNEVRTSDLNFSSSGDSEKIFDIFNKKYYDELKNINIISNHIFQEIKTLPFKIVKEINEIYSDIFKTYKNIEKFSNFYENYSMKSDDDRDELFLTNMMDEFTSKYPSFIIDSIINVPEKYLKIIGSKYINNLSQVVKSFVVSGNLSFDNPIILDFKDDDLGDKDKTIIKTLLSFEQEHRRKNQTIFKNYTVSLNEEMLIIMKLKIFKEEVKDKKLSFYIESDLDDIVYIFNNSYYDELKNIDIINNRIFEEIKFFSPKIISEINTVYEDIQEIFMNIKKVYNFYKNYHDMEEFKKEIKNNYSNIVNIPKDYLEILGYNYVNNLPPQLRSIILGENETFSNIDIDRNVEKVIDVLQDFENVLRKKNLSFFLKDDQEEIENIFEKNWDYSLSVPLNNIIFYKLLNYPQKIIKMLNSKYILYINNYNYLTEVIQFYDDSENINETNILIQEKYPSLLKMTKQDLEIYGDIWYKKLPIKLQSLLFGRITISVDENTNKDVVINKDIKTKTVLNDMLKDSDRIDKTNLNVLKNLDLKFFDLKQTPQGRKIFNTIQMILVREFDTTKKMAIVNFIKNLIKNMNIFYVQLNKLGAREQKIDMKIYTGQYQNTLGENERKKFIMEKKNINNEREMIKEKMKKYGYREGDNVYNLNKFISNIFNIEIEEKKQEKEIPNIKSLTDINVSSSLSTLKSTGSRKKRRRIEMDDDDDLEDELTVKKTKIKKDDKKSILEDEKYFKELTTNIENLEGRISEEKKRVLKEEMNEEIKFLQKEQEKIILKLRSEEDYKLKNILSDSTLLEEVLEKKNIVKDLEQMGLKTGLDDNIDFLTNKMSSINFSENDTELTDLFENLKLDKGGVEKMMNEMVDVKNKINNIIEENVYDKTLSLSSLEDELNLIADDNMLKDLDKDYQIIIKEDKKENIKESIIDILNILRFLMTLPNGYLYLYSNIDMFIENNEKFGERTVNYLKKWLMVPKKQQENIVSVKNLLLSSSLNTREKVNNIVKTILEIDEYNVDKTPKNINYDKLKSNLRGIKNMIGFFYETYINNYDGNGSIEEHINSRDKIKITRDFLLKFFNLVFKLLSHNDLVVVRDILIKNIIMNEEYKKYINEDFYKNIIPEPNILTHYLTLLSQGNGTIFDKSFVNMDEKQKNKYYVITYYGNQYYYYYFFNTLLSRISADKIIIINNSDSLQNDFIRVAGEFNIKLIFNKEDDVEKIMKFIDKEYSNSKIINTNPLNILSKTNNVEKIKKLIQENKIPGFKHTTKGDNKTIEENDNLIKFFIRKKNNINGGLDITKKPYTNNICLFLYKGENVYEYILLDKLLQKYPGSNIVFVNLSDNDFFKHPCFKMNIYYYLNVESNENGEKIPDSKKIMNMISNDFKDKYDMKLQETDFKIYDTYEILEENLYEKYSPEEIEKRINNKQIYGLRNDLESSKEMIKKNIMIKMEKNTNSPKIKSALNKSQLNIEMLKIKKISLMKNYSKQLEKETDEYKKLFISNKKFENQVSDLKLFLNKITNFYQSSVEDKEKKVNFQKTILRFKNIFSNIKDNEKKTLFLSKLIMDLFNKFETDDNISIDTLNNMKETIEKSNFIIKDIEMELKEIILLPDKIQDYIEKKDDNIDREIARLELKNMILEHKYFDNPTKYVSKDVINENREKSKSLGSKILYDFLKYTNLDELILNTLEKYDEKLPEIESFYNIPEYHFKDIYNYYDIPIYDNEKNRLLTSNEIKELISRISQKVEFYDKVRNLFKQSKELKIMIDNNDKQLFEIFNDDKFRNYIIGITYRWKRDYDNNFKSLMNYMNNLFL